MEISDDASDQRLPVLDSSRLQPRACIAPSRWACWCLPCCRAGVSMLLPPIDAACRWLTLHLTTLNKRTILQALHSPHLSVAPSPHPYMVVATADAIRAPSCAFHVVKLAPSCIDSTTPFSPWPTPSRADTYVADCCMSWSLASHCLYPLAPFVICYVFATYPFSTLRNHYRYTGTTLALEGNRAHYAAPPGNL